MINTLRKDIKAIMHRDPAARSKLEVVFCYPGFHSILLHRVAFLLYRLRFKGLARCVSTLNRFLTGVDIHPGAKIGDGLFIDHGMGVVIGETCEIGNNVTLYQGVTLGGTGKESGKRHPMIGNNVVISSGAKILGPFKVGDHSKIGANAVVLKEVPPFCTVVGVPGRIVKHHNKPVKKGLEIDLDQVQLPDPIQEQLMLMLLKIQMLEGKVAELENKVMDRAV